VISPRDRQTLSELFQGHQGSKDTASPGSYWTQPHIAQALLHIANQTPDGKKWAGELTLPAGSKAQAIALDLITRAVRQFKGDDYRTLGVNAFSPSADIKEHHRLLIRLYHPDRTTLPLEEAEALAAQINHAFSSLGKADQAIDNAAHIRSLQEARLARKLQRKPPPSSILSKLPPGAMMGLAAILMLVFVVSIYQENHQISMIRAVPGQTNDDNMTAEAQWAKKLSFNKPAPSVTTEVDSSIEPPAKAAKPAINHLATKQNKPIQQTVSSEIAPVKQDAAATPSPQHEVKLASTEPVKVIDDKKIEEKKVDIKTVNDAPQKSLAANLSQEQVRQVSVAFLDSYNQGNLESFLRLFSDEVKMDGVYDKDTLRTSYARLFSSPGTREMVWRNPQWKINQNAASGNMDYVVKLKDKGSTKVLGGTLDLELKSVSGQVQIVAMSHHPEKQ
jgi:hypothetical protein